jgi:hypothetical protein
MNSLQRRKSKREHPHSVTIRTVEQEQYFKHDEKVHKAVQWCRKHCKDSWRIASDWDHADFKFSNQKDAIYFALKWA